MFKDCQTGDLSNAEWLADSVVNIPGSVVIKRQIICVYTSHGINQDIFIFIYLFSRYK